jgi:LysM repeat protein
VAPGDTLFNIAWRSGSSVDALMAANCLEGTQIIVGQTLYVPGTVAPLETPVPQPIWFYLIMPDDNGQSGPPVGCGDSAVAVRSARSSTGSLEGDIRASLQELFSIRTPNYGQSGYAHSLHAANLAVQSVTVDGGRATIRLTGALPLIGTCADARMEAQIRLTVFQYGGFDSAMIILDGTNLRQLFDMSGTVGSDEPYRR